MTISALPTPPSRDDPANFASRGDAFLGALPTFQTEANALAGDVNADAVAAAAAQSAAETAQTGAETAQGLAEDARDAAAASASSALTAPGTSATSTTSLAIGTGSKSLTIQTGKAYSVGQSVAIADDAAPSTNWMWGQITSYNSGTGALVVNVATIGGSGTKTAWTVSLSANMAPGVSTAMLVVEATTSTTLTSAPTLLKITPSGYGVIVTLPDATGCNEGQLPSIIDNQGSYPVKVLDSSGTALGFVEGAKRVSAYLIDSSTAAGQWLFTPDLALAATVNRYTVTAPGTVSSLAATQTIPLTDNRYMLFYGYSSTAFAAIIYDAENDTFGSSVLVRSGVNVGSYQYARALSLGSGSVLLVTLASNSTALQAVVLTTSGTTITVNTAATATATNTNAVNLELIAVGTKFLIGHDTGTGVAPVCRVLTISGTTVTIGAETAFPNGVNSHPGHYYEVSSTTALAIRHVSAGATGLSIAVISISGTTPTINTAITAPSEAIPTTCALSTGRWMVGHYASSVGYCSIISVSGTTPSISTANLSTSNGTVGLINLGTYALAFTAAGNAYAVADSSGTASAGTGVVSPANLRGYFSGAWIGTVGTAPFQSIGMTVSGTTLTLTTPRVVWGNSLPTEIGNNTAFLTTTAKLDSALYQPCLASANNAVYYTHTQINEIVVRNGVLSVSPTASTRLPITTTGRAMVSQSTGFAIETVASSATMYFYKVQIA